MPAKSSFKTCGNCGSTYTGRQCPQCYTTRGAPMQSMAAVFEAVRSPETSGEGPQPGDTTTFTDEPGIVYLVIEVGRDDKTGKSIARIQAPGREAEWVYADDWK